MKRFLTSVSIFSLLFACRLAGQIGTAVVVGRVTDSSGAVLVSAEIQMTRLATNEAYRTTTTNTGAYSISSLPVGTYELRVSMAGFKTEARTGITLEVGRTYRIDVPLTVGNVTETLEITSAAPVLKTETPEFGQVIDNRRIMDIPLNGRDVLGSLSILTPGTAPARSARLGSGIDVNVRGQRRSDNVLLVDGTMMSQGNAAVTFFLNPDTVQEFEVKTGLYGAEYGVKPGGQFSMVTKSGTNELHGTLFEFVRNNKLDARNFFDPGPRPGFKRNQFGAVAGGPVYIPKLFNGKDRMWWFFGYGGQRLRQFRPLTGNVVTPDEKAGRFARSITDPTTRQPFPNNAIPASRISPMSAKFLGFWPEPNTTGRGFNYTSPNSVDKTTSDQYVARLDFRVSDTDHWSGRLIRDIAPIYINNAIPIFYGYEPFGTWALAASNTRTFSARLVNEFGVHFFRRPFYQGWKGENQSAQGFGKTLGIAGFPAGPLDVNGVPVVSVTGILGLGDRDNAGPSITGGWEVRDTASFNTGSHSLKAGYHYRRHIEHYAFRRRTTFAFDQRYTGYGFSDFLLGQVYTVRPAVEDLRGRVNQPGHYLFVQDSWKVRSNLTLSLGLRYEYRAPLRDQRGFNSSFNFDTGRFVPPLETRALQPWETGRFEPNKPLVEWSKKGWLPRIGIAYRPARKFVVRTGFGIFANEPPLGMFQDMGRNPRPGAESLVFTGNATTPNISFADPFNRSVVTPGSTAPTLTGFESPLANWMVYNWGLSIQRELSAEMVFEIGYQGSKTTHELTIISANDATPGTEPRQSRRPYPQYQQINFVRPIGSASYNGMEISLRKRPGASGLSLLTAYTFAKSIDMMGGRLGVPGDPSGISRNMTLAQNRGLGETHIPHRFVTNAGYQLPFGKGKSMATEGFGAALLGGWTLNGTLSLEKGRWFTPAMSSDILDVGSTVTARPDVLRNPNLAADARRPQQWFDSAAFQRPPLTRYGNAGRGIIEGPGLFNVDLSVLRSFRIRERSRLEFRFETFNLTNHTNFDLPGNSFGVASFGVIGSAMESRDLQLGLKIYF